MPQRLHVLTRVSDIPRFRRQLVSIDAQPLDPSAFSVHAVPDALDEADAERLERLAAYRPNLTVADPAADWSLAVSGAVSALPEGDYVLPLGYDEILLPGGLATLADALATDPDVVVARGVAPGRLTDWDLFSRSAGHASAYDAQDFTHVAVLVRASALRDAAAPSGELAELRHAAVAAARTVRPEGGAPVLRGPAETPDSRGQAPVWARASWSEGAVEVVLELGPDVPAVSHVSLRNLDSGVDWRVDWTEHDDGLRASLDPTTAAAGAALAPGRWVLDVQATSGTVHAVRWRETPGSALLGSLLVAAVKGKGERLLLDVGATRRSPFGELDLGAAEVEEDARGTELRWRLPLSPVTGSSTLPAAVRLGDFPLAAQVRTDAGEAHLHAWLSGLAGRTPLALAVAGSPYHESGYDLEIALTGEMELRPHAEGDSPGQAAAPRRAASGLAGKLRGRLGR